MNERKLFVGNLNYAVTKDQLIALFSKHGEVLDVKVMEGKGYAFIEMANPQQAQRIKNTLRETEFEGRRLLIDDVPSRQHQGGKGRVAQPDSPRTNRSYGRGERSENREYRPGPYGRSGKSEESVRHLNDVTGEFKAGPKPGGKGKDVQKPVTKPGAQEQRIPRQDNIPTQRTGAVKPGTKKSEGERPVKKGWQDERKPRANPRDGTPGSGSDKRPARQVSKKIKEAPPKNPHPYQGSKKSKKPASQKEPQLSTPKPEENEKQHFLRYWATLSGKKKE